MSTSRIALVGVGNIGRRVLELLRDKERDLRERYDLAFSLVAAADSRGAAVSPSGLGLTEILSLKEAGHSVASYPGVGIGRLAAAEALARTDVDLLIEVSPTNLQTGEPGLSVISWALAHGCDVVTANKGPLVLAYTRLSALAAENQRALLFSGAVAGGLPTVNIGRRDLAGARVLRVEGVFNTTTNYILLRMQEDGLAFEQALREAQAAGVAEADPSLDIDGWDAANKLVILANSVLGVAATLEDVTVRGVRDIGRDDLLRARAKGCALKLLVQAVLRDGDYALSVAPTELPLEHPLARLRRWEMGVVYTTDIMGTITAIIEDEGTTATAGAVLRDVVNLSLARRSTTVLGE